MKIICPYTNLNSVTELVLKTEYRYDVQFYDVSESDHSYFDLMHAMWKEQETFIVVEHDIVPWPGALKKIFNCPYKLCVYLTPHGMGDKDYSYGLGIWRFNKWLMQQFPDHLDDSKLTREWHHLDGELVTRLNEKGIRNHIHEPPVVHLNTNRFPTITSLGEK